MRFLHTADMHLGAHLECFYDDRQYSILKALVELADSRNVHDIIIAGDIFDKPHPDQKIKDYLLRYVLDTPHINWYFVLGNHDYTDKDKSYHSLVFLELVENIVDNVHVCEPGNNYSFDHFNLIVLDEDCNPVEVPDNSAPNVVAMHGILKGIFGLEKSKAASEFASKLLKTYNAKYIALGDIHKSMKILDNCRYPGALIQKTYACEEGILEVDIVESTVKELSLDLPKKLALSVKLNSEDFSSDKSVEKLIADSVSGITDKYSLLKLKFELPVHLWASIDKKRLREYLGDFIELKLHNTPVVEIQENSQVESTTVKDDINEVVEALNTDLNKKRLKKICFGMIEK